MITKTAINAEITDIRQILLYAKQEKDPIQSDRWLEHAARKLDLLRDDTSGVNG